MKLTKTLAGKKIYELEQANSNISNINYSQIFDPILVKKIKSNEFQTKIGQYLEKSEKIYDKYSFFYKEINGFDDFGYNMYI